MSFDATGERLFSLHRRLPFAHFLITNLVIGTLGFSIIFPLIIFSPPRPSYIAPRYLLDFCSRCHVGPSFVFSTMLLRVYEMKGNTCDCI